MSLPKKKKTMSLTISLPKKKKIKMTKKNPKKKKLKAKQKKLFLLDKRWKLNIRTTGTKLRLWEITLV